MKKNILSYKDFIITVEYQPNFIERLFNIKPKIKKFTWNDTYWIDSMKAWIDMETGKEFGRCKRFDDYVRLKVISRRYE